MSDTQDVLIRGIDANLHRELRKAVIDRDTSVQAVLLQIVEDGIKQWLEGGMESGIPGLRNGVHMTTAMVASLQVGDQVGDSADLATFAPDVLAAIKARGVRWRKVPVAGIIYTVGVILGEPRIELWRHAKSGERFAVQTDGSTIFKASGPLHHSEIAAALDGDFDGDPDVEADMAMAEDDEYQIERR